MSQDNAIDAESTGEKGLTPEEAQKVPKKIIRRKGSPKKYKKIRKLPRGLVRRESSIPPPEHELGGPEPRLPPPSEEVPPVNPPEDESPGEGDNGAEALIVGASKKKRRIRKMRVLLREYYNGELPPPFRGVVPNIPTWKMSRKEFTRWARTQPGETGSYARTSNSMIPGTIPYIFLEVERYQHVKKALDENKKVPRDVLRDYPDMLPGGPGAWVKFKRWVWKIKESGWPFLWNKIFSYKLDFKWATVPLWLLFLIVALGRLGIIILVLYIVLYKDPEWPRDVEYRDYKGPEPIPELGDLTTVPKRANINKGEIGPYVFNKVEKR